MWITRLIIRIIRVSPVLVAGVLLSGCNGRDALDLGQTGSSASSVLEQVHGSWGMTTGDRYTIRFDGDVAFLETQTEQNMAEGRMAGQRMMVRLAQLDTCGDASGPRLVQATVEHSPDDPSLVGDTICWRLSEVEGDTLTIENVKDGKPYHLSRTQE